MDMELNEIGLAFFDPLSSCKHCYDCDAEVRHDHFFPKQSKTTKDGKCRRKSQLNVWNRPAWAVTSIHYDEIVENGESENSLCL